ncbi:hypothetical protein Salat_2793700 [Sesamum alatum]|uniref:PWWP domain-containing protein n=1 Tax=Sesamum alatum TaxID=300844 RepID=A0AAE2C994_9LAMI|nr:hypothetical protein Salat_2793700 [Sesamum alatum]
MGSSGEDPKKTIDASVGGLVWVRRRNGCWWPGKILGPDELPEGCVPTPRAGTPVKLLGREDASVDWYNLEKSKRVKAFHCGEYDDCIEKAKASASHLSKKAAKYARREDAILHALELESARFGGDHQDFSATPETQDGEHHHAADSPSTFHPSEESEDVDDELDSSEDDSDSAQQLSQSGVSFEEPDHVDSAKEESKHPRTPNDSEDDGVGVKRTRGLEDLGMGVASSPKRKRSQVPHVHEFLKRKNRRRTLTKVLESTTVVSVPLVSEQLSSPTGSSVPVASDSKVSGLESSESKNNNSVVINNNSDSNGVSCENETLLEASKHPTDASLKCKQKDAEVSSTGLPDNESLQKLFDVPLVAEQKHSAGMPSVFPDASQKGTARAGVQSSQSSHVETISPGNEEHNESGSTGSATANVHHISQMIEKGTNKWRLKGKRNSRSRKVDVDDEAETYVASNDVNRSLILDSGGYHVKSRPITETQVEEFRGWSWNVPQKESRRRGSTPDLLVPQRLLPYRQSRFTVNPKYDSSDFSLRHHIAGSALYDVSVKALDDGFCNDLFVVSECRSSSSDLDYNLIDDKHVTTVYQQRPHRRPHSKHWSAHSLPAKPPRSRRNGFLSKKIRKLSSLTGSHRLSREEKKRVADKLKGPSIACIPLNVVFSRINAALNSSVRPRPI